MKFDRGCNENGYFANWSVKVICGHHVTTLTSNDFQ